MLGRGELADAVTKVEDVGRATGVRVGVGLAKAVQHAAHLRRDRLGRQPVHRRGIDQITRRHVHAARDAPRPAVVRAAGAGKLFGAEGVDEALAGIVDSARHALGIDVPTIRTRMALIQDQTLPATEGMLPPDKVDAECSYLAIAIEKTAGPAEREAWSWLLEKINKGLADIKADGTYDQILKKPLITEKATMMKDAANTVAFAVGGYITAAYWFTSSTSFANPAVTIGRAFTDTYVGIAWESVLPFILAQLVGGVVGLGLVKVVTKA